MQFTVFPDEDASMEFAAKRSGLILDGPHPALLIRGVDELGALADVHLKFEQADVRPFSTNGISGGSGNFAYIVYLRPGQFERAAASLEV